jgi:hypothetical protein
LIVLETILRDKNGESVQTIHQTFVGRR